MDNGENDVTNSDLQAKLDCVWPDRTLGGGPCRRVNVIELEDEVQEFTRRKNATNSVSAS